MRIRSIRPEFWSSEDIAAMDWHSRLVYIGLWSYVDDNGVGRDLERLIVADLFPLDEDLSEASLRVHRALKHLEAAGNITRYMVDGKPYLHITKWTTHQKINRASEGRYPLPTSDNAEIHAPLSEPSVSPHAKAPLGEGEKGRRGEGEKHSPTESVGAKRARQLPADWQPTDHHHEIATERGVNLAAEAEKFRDWCGATGKTYKDHDLAFNGWLRRATPDRTQSRHRDADSRDALLQAHFDMEGQPQ